MLPHVEVVWGGGAVERNIMLDKEH